MVIGRETGKWEGGEEMKEKEKGRGRDKDKKQEEQKNEKRRPRITEEERLLQ